MFGRREGIGQNHELQDFLAQEAQIPDPELANERSGIVTSAAHIESGQDTYALAALVGQEAVAGATGPETSDEEYDMSVSELFAAYQLATGKHVIPVTKETRSGIIVVGAIEEADFPRIEPS